MKLKEINWTKVTIYFGLVLVFAALVAGAYIYFGANRKNNDSNKVVSSGVTISNITKEDVAAVKNLTSAAGSVTSVDPTRLVVKTGTKSLTLKLDDKVTVKTGVREDPSSISKVTVGKNVSVLYDATSMTANNIWFAEEK